eukprot:5635417-Amphidinium_carterae.1
MLRQPPSPTSTCWREYKKCTQPHHGPTPKQAVRTKRESRRNEVAWMSQSDTKLEARLGVSPSKVKIEGKPTAETYEQLVETRLESMQEERKAITKQK